MTDTALATTARRVLQTAVLCLGLAGTAHTAQAADWQSAGSFTTERYLHTATQLPDGRVLVTGGRTANAPIASTQIYDPANGRWTNGPPLPVSAGSSRAGHTATLLRTGDVLVTGGTNNTSTLGSVVLYTAQWGDFYLDQNLITARQEHTATLLQDGRVLIVGGRSYNDPSAPGASTPQARAEIYDPASHTLTPAGQLATARHGHTATLLADGRVLVAGGWGTALAPLASAEVYDPQANQWNPAAPLPAARTRHTATLLPNGQVFLAGGATTAGNPLASTLLYDGNAWQNGPSLSTVREYHSATLLADGRVLIAGGRNAAVTTGGNDIPGAALATTEVFDPATGQVTSLGALAQARYAATALLLHSGELLLTGGLADAATALNSAERLQPAALTTVAANALPAPRAYHQATPIAGGLLITRGALPTLRYDSTSGQWQSTAPMAEARDFHTQTLLPDGRVLAAGGAGQSAPALASAETYAPATNLWTPVQPMLQARSGHTATLLASGEVLVTGGIDNNGALLASAEVFQPATGTWRAAPPLQNKRHSHTATLLPDGRVMVAGGNNGVGGAQVSVEFYSPATGTWTPGPAMPMGRALHSAMLLPSGQMLFTGGRTLSSSGPIAGADLYDPATNTWQATGSPQNARYRHQATLLPDGRVLVTGGLIGITEDPTATAETYDPIAGTWQSAPAMLQARTSHTATALPDGGVLIAGGNTTWLSTSPTVTTQLYLVAPRASDARRPAITAVHPAALAPGDALTLTGLRFTADGEGSGGGTAQAATHTPLLRLQRVDNGAVAWLPVEQSSATQFTARALDPTQNLAAGPYYATLYAGGMASDAVLLRVDAQLAAPNPPTNVTATPGNGQVTVSWQAPATGTPPTSYTVTAQPGGASCTAQAPATGCTVAGLTNGMPYVFTVTANTAGGSASAPPTGNVTPTAAGPGPGPGGVQAVPTLSEWGVLLLALLVLSTGWRMRREP